MKNVILSGGNGTRLWPLSRKLLPKQFLKLFDNTSLFQLTIKRNLDICDSFMILSNIEQYFIALDQYEELNINKTAEFILEEEAKNTAAAIAFSAFHSDKDEILFVTPSDHLIHNNAKYHEAIQQAKELAKDGYLVTFGITPDEIHTGYGYIEAQGFDVVKFHEKPDYQTAKHYIQANKHQAKYFFNSGMFMFKAGVFLEELKLHSPNVYKQALNSYNSKQTINQQQIRIKNMHSIPDISIDYAVMEKSAKIKMIPAMFGWNDVGSFDSLTKEIPTKEGIEINSQNNFYYSLEDNKLIAGIGIEDLIVIDTADALLIAKKGQTQNVKQIVEKLKQQHKELLTTHTTVYRPWGSFETLIDKNGYKIKRIIVKPNQRLSLQKHFHRSEHWIVVSGTAEVQVGQKSYLVRPNESTYIKAGEEHRLSNPGKIPVVLIEVQVGEYTKEDDIIRIEDDYKRDE
ncbi:MAG: mannose-1-phosphate guanylyltransferase/mannose-6-phosphate isomerase [Epsilonproteobacteria bacterium]|nr:mannose-1-phosphate guanylyltransferase/mannose-6-phosphate isomerase [Campylobacterota bacterium]